MWTVKRSGLIRFGPYGGLNLSHPRQSRMPARLSRCVYKNSSGDEIANVNFFTTISHTRRPTSKIPKRDKPTSFNKLNDR